MKKIFEKPMLHFGKIILIILTLPFALAGVLGWAMILLGKAAAESIKKKRPAAKLH